jgi:ParB family chromosome partitioning protein
MTAPLSRRSKIEQIEIDRIHVLNPRVRNQKVFQEISANIVDVGMKRPITVTPSRAGVAGREYDLVCGQGRMEAFKAAGMRKIWALIIDADEEQALIMSLVENLARRQHRPVDLLQGIEVLSKQGYGTMTIAKKTGLTATYVSEVLNLMEKGEERLINAVENGTIPMYLAVRIADSPEEEQKALQEAYESKALRGNRLLAAQKLIERRRRRGKGLSDEGRVPRERRPLSGSDVVKAFERETERKKLLIRKANAVGDRLVFITQAMRLLISDDNFHTLLRAEGLNTLPKGLAERMNDRPRYVR